MKSNKQTGMRYVSDIPSEPLAEGIVLVHNHVKPHRTLSGRGFRAWTQALDNTLEVCICDWAGMDLHGLEHYRIKAK